MGVLIQTRYLARLAGALLITIGMSACTSTPATVEELPPPVEAVSTEEYRIGVGDGIQVSVWRNPDLSSSVPVRPDGKISAPLAGDVMAAGKTAEELSDDIANILKKYLRTPHVTVIVTNPTSTEFIHRVRVTGAIGSPSSMPYRRNMTILDLVLTSGGLTPFAAGNKAKLYRHSGEEVKIYDVYIDDILEKGDLRTNYTLIPQDMLIIPERLF